MPGDEVAAETGTARRSATRPRHAAPRRSLLGRLQVPAGKAIALAAMPSAVLMGMGFTPRLAEADEMPKNGYAPGKCVTVPDIPAGEADDAGDKAAAPSAGPARSATTAPADGPDEDAGDGKDGKDPRDLKGVKDGKDLKSIGEDLKSLKDLKDPGRTGGPGETGDSRGTGDGTGAPDGEKDRPGLLDPVLGPVFDPVKDLFDPGRGGGDEDQGQDGGSGPAGAPSPPAPRPSGGPGGPSAGPTRGPDVPDAPERGEDGGKPAARKPPAASPSPPAGGTAGAPETGPPVDDRGRELFPCPEEKKVAGENERTPDVLPDKPWILKSTLLALHGLDYRGVVNVRTANGGTKQALKFTASGVDIHDLHQLVDGGGYTYHVEARKGSTSEIRKGTVTMYTEKLEGRLLGIIPITFDPGHPPPVNLPEIFFTDVTVTQAGQFGGELNIPGMHVYTTRA